MPHKPVSMLALLIASLVVALSGCSLYAEGAPPVVDRAQSPMAGRWHVAWSCVRWHPWRCARNPWSWVTALEVADVGHRVSLRWHDGADVGRAVEEMGTRTDPDATCVLVAATVGHGEYQVCPTWPDADAMNATIAWPSSLWQASLRRAGSGEE